MTWSSSIVAVLSDIIAKWTQDSFNGAMAFPSILRSQTLPHEPSLSTLNPPSSLFFLWGIIASIAHALQNNNNMTMATTLMIMMTLMMMAFSVPHTQLSRPSLDAATWHIRILAGGFARWRSISNTFPTGWAQTTCSQKVNGGLLVSEYFRGSWKTQSCRSETFCIH